MGKRLTEHPAGLHNPLQTGAHGNAKRQHAGRETQSARKGSAVILRAGTWRTHECLASRARLKLVCPIAAVVKPGSRVVGGDGFQCFRDGLLQGFLGARLRLAQHCLNLDQACSIGFRSGE